MLGSRASPPPLPRAPRGLACWQLRPQFSGNPAVVGEMTKALQPAATVPARHTALCTLHTAHCTIEGAACHVCIASHGRCHGGSRTQQQSAVSAHRRRRNRAMLRFSFPRQTVELLTRAPSAGCASSLAPVGRRRPWGGGRKKDWGAQGTCTLHGRCAYAFAPGDRGRRHGEQRTGRERGDAAQPTTSPAIKRTVAWGKL